MSDATEEMEWIDGDADELRFGLRELSLLSPGARQAFWDALLPSLSTPLPQGIDQHLEHFCRDHDAPPARLSRALKACRTVLRAAAQADVGAAQVEAALRHLGGDAEICKLLLSRFDSVMTTLRREILLGSLADHGKLLVGVDWRVDSMLMSHRGKKLRSPVAQVTLRYSEGGEQKRVTVQALPETLRELEKMCREILA